MDACPVCGRQAEGLHPVPPEVITKELIDALDAEETASDLGLCADCIDRLMDGEAPVEPLPFR